MPQLHFYVPKETAERIKRHARARRMSVSRYVAGVIKESLGEGWPEDYFEEVVGGWKGPPPVRPDQGAPETRRSL